MTKQEREELINDRADNMITKLRTIKRLARRGGIVAPYHLDELRELMDSLRHHTTEQAKENTVTGICGF